MPIFPERTNPQRIVAFTTESALACTVVKKKVNCLYGLGISRWFLMQDLSVQIGNIDDLELLVKHRLGMWLDIYPDMEPEITASTEETRNWIRGKLLQNVLIPFIARMSGNEIAGSGCILIKEDQPRINFHSIDYPYLLSMFTERNFRRRGVATAVTTAAVEWSREHGYDRVILHASTQGRSVYEKLGFETTNEMRLKL